MIKFLVNGGEVSREEFDSKLEENINKECESTYDDYLDECNQEINIEDSTFSPSLVLERCDPTAYKRGVSDYQSDELEKAEYELDHADFIVVGDDEFSIVVEENGEEEGE